MNANASGTPPRLAATPLNAMASVRNHFGRRAVAIAYASSVPNPTPTTPHQNDSSTENLNASRFCPVNASRNVPKPMLPSLTDQRLGEDADRRDDQEQEQEGEERHQARTRPSCAVVWCPGDGSRARGTAPVDRQVGHDEPVRHRPPSGPSSAWRTSLAAAICAGVMNTIWAIRSSGGRFTLSAADTLPASTSCW